MGDSWKKSFGLFAKWAIGEGYDEQKECVIKRLNTKRPYLPSNCKVVVKGPRKIKLQAGNSQLNRLYSIWSAMKQRCLNPNNPEWDSYGGRGIGICGEWLSFESFEAWSLPNGYDEFLSIDRVDNNKGYSPDNCRWANQKTQKRNTRVNRWVELDGERMCMKDAADELGINNSNITRWFSPNYPNRKVPAKYRERIRLVS